MRTDDGFAKAADSVKFAAMRSNISPPLPIRPYARIAICLAALGIALPLSAQETSQPQAAAAVHHVKGSSMAHIVQQGDTLAGLCKKWNIAATQCAQVAYFNRLENNRLPAQGSTVYVPLDLLPSRPEQVRLIQTTGQVTIGGQTVQAGIRLDENTRITAAANSSAVLEVADGARVKVLPSSVAEIVRNRSYTSPESATSSKIVQWLGSKIRLVQGALESAVKKSDKPHPNKPVEVETLTSIIGVRGTEFRVATADAAFPYDRAEVIQGQVSNINTWKHSEIALSAGHGAVVDPNKAEMQAVALLPAPQVPKQGMVLRRPRAIWQFNPVPGAVAYRIIASGDETFNTIAYSAKVTKPETDLGQLPSNGTWYLRARAINPQGLEGLDAHSAIELRQPAWIWRNPSVQNRRRVPHLQWTGVATTDLALLPGITTVKVAIARDKAFTRTLAQLQTTGHNLPLPHLGPGRYYLRVSVENDSIKNDEQQTFMLDWTGLTHDASYNLLLQEVS